MGQNHDTLNNTSQTQDSITTNTLKSWETPKLKILPVPTKTMGGGGPKKNQDDVYYKKS